MPRYTHISQQKGHVDRPWNWWRRLTPAQRSNNDAVRGLTPTAHTDDALRARHTHGTAPRLAPKIVREPPPRRAQGRLWGTKLSGSIARAVVFSSIACCLVVLSGCHKNSSAAKHVPPPPPPKTAPTTTPSTTATVTKPAPEVTVSPKAKPIYVETGLASWYGPQYHNHKGSNGEVYDQNGMTAAHRTIPLNSVVRVTNETTKHSVVVRITDRGPFIEDRIIDLSLAAAKAVDVWQPGTAIVKVEVLTSPAPIQEGGRWCVQIGAFQSEDEARKLKEKLQDRYSTAKVVQFTGPTGEWVRLRPAGDDKKQAQEVAAKTHVKEGGVFLVRLD
jgi:rare lipoprotein A